MKIDRRGFLSLGVGAAAGIVVTPLPWKLTDDLSIWTQNWPWTPVPADGEKAYTKSVCSLCPGGCGISVRKVEDRAIKIEGIEGHPVNDGGICILGLSGLQTLYGPTRVKQPLMRSGNRGEGRWQKVDWDTALAEITKRLAEIRKAGQAHTVACVAGSDQGTVPQLLKRFLAAYGSSNFIRTPSIRDSYELAFKTMQGSEASAGFDLFNSDFVLSFGSGVIEGWGSPVYMFRANSELRGKGKVVQIEPRLSNTAAKSDKWVPINPGTEAVLALGLAHEIIKESLYNKEFVEKYAAGFESWEDAKGQKQKGFKDWVLENYWPASVANITGVKPAVIHELAVSFAKASKPVALCGRGQGNTPVSLFESMAIHALNALVGNINQKGGISAVPFADYINWPKAPADAVAEAGLQQPRIDGAQSDPFASRYLLNRVVNAAESGKPYALQALLVWEADPIYTLSGSAAVKAAFDKIPFVVSFSSHMNETAQYADLILPDHFYLERYQDIPTPVGMAVPSISLSRPVVKPQFDTKYTGDVLIQVAKGIGGNLAEAMPWKDYEQCLKETLGDQWDKLDAKGFLMDDQYQTPAWDKAFKTASGKFEFCALTAIGEAASIEGDKEAYPLTLIPYDSMRLANGFIGDPPFVIKTVSDRILKKKDIFVEINPETAKQYGVSDGKLAVLETPRGSARVRVNVFEGIVPGVIAMPRGLGHKAYDKYLAGKGLNVNEFIGSVEDPVSGLDAVWGIRAKLTIA